MIKVGVIRGGVGAHYDISLKEGGAVLLHLRNEKLNKKYSAIDILIDKEGLWHLNGLPVPLEKVARSVDVALNTVHGKLGEDGKIEQILDNWNIPHGGPGALSSAITFHKNISNEHLEKIGVKIPKHVLLPAYQEDFDGSKEVYAQKKSRQIFEKMSPPWIVKPLTKGSSLASFVCKTLPELIHALEYGELAGVSVLVEEMIFGKEASISVVKDFRGQGLYTLPSAEIKNKAISVPSNFSKEEKAELDRLAKHIHSNLQLNNYSKSDFIVSPKGIYSLNVSTIPEVNEDSYIYHALHAVGSNNSELIDHIIQLALNKK